MHRFWMPRGINYNICSGPYDLFIGFKGYKVYKMAKELSLEHGKDKKTVF